MPFKECLRLDDDQSFTPIEEPRKQDHERARGSGGTRECREFNISRKTGYKILERYEQCGVEGLSDRARRPFRYANQLPEPVKAAIVVARREKPTWGARKIRERLLQRLPHAVKVPACSTIHAVLDRHGLVSRPQRPRNTSLSEGLKPNDVASGHPFR